MLNNQHSSKFTDLSPVLTARLRKFLNRENVVTRMKIVSEYDIAAVEGIPEKDFLKEFGDEVREDRAKQFIGSVVREIMEDQGFKLYSQGAKIRFGSVFSRGSKYRPSNGGQFRSPESK